MAGRTNRGPSCMVSDVYGLSLFMSRMAGAAPLRMVRRRDGWQVSYSPTAYVYSCLFLAVLHTILAVTLVNDFLASEKSDRMRNTTSSFGWIIALVFDCAVATLTVFEAPKRMKLMINYHNLIFKMQSQVGNKQTRAAGEKKTLLYFVLLIVIIILSIHFYSYYTETVRTGTNLMVACLYWSYYLEGLITVMLLMQFIFEAQIINSALKNVNNSLSDLVKLLDLPMPTTQISNTVPEAVRCLVLSFGALVDVMRQTNRNYGKPLLLLTGSYCIYLIVTPYYLILFIYTSKKIDVASGFQIVVYIFDFTLFSLLLEPGHQTKMEFERTKKLISQLLRRVSSPKDPLAMELYHFCQQIELNKFSYKPLGVITLHRPLIPAIFGVVTTYFFAVFQFQ